MSEVENEVEVEVNPIQDMIGSIETGDYNNAEKQFNSLVGDRLQDALDQAKVRIAQSVFGEEEVEAAIDEVESEENEDDEEI